MRKRVVGLLAKLFQFRSSLNRLESGFRPRQEPADRQTRINRELHGPEGRRTVPRLRMSDRQHVMRLGVVRQFFEDRLKIGNCPRGMTLDDFLQRVLMHPLILIEPWLILSISEAWTGQQANKNGDYFHAVRIHLAKPLGMLVVANYGRYNYHVHSHAVTPANLRSRFVIQHALTPIQFTRIAATDTTLTQSAKLK